MRKPGRAGDSPVSSRDFDPRDFDSGVSNSTRLMPALADAVHSLATGAQATLEVIASVCRIFLCMSHSLVIAKPQGPEENPEDKLLKTDRDGSAGAYETNARPRGMIDRATLAAALPNTEIERRAPMSLYEISRVFGTPIHSPYLSGELRGSQGRGFAHLTARDFEHVKS